MQHCSAADDVPCCIRCDARKDRSAAHGKPQTGAMGVNGRERCMLHVTHCMPCAARCILYIGCPFDIGCAHNALHTSSRPVEVHVVDEGRLCGGRLQANRHSKLHEFADRLLPTGPRERDVAAHRQRRSAPTDRPETTWTTASARCRSRERGSPPPTSPTAGPRRVHLAHTGKRGSCCNSG